MTDADEWKRWTDARTAAVSTAHGVLALTATHWLGPEPTELPGLPGRWSGDAAGIRVTARAADGLRPVGGNGAAAGGVVPAVEEPPIDGELLLHPDTQPEADRLRWRDLLLVPIEREGEPALRVFDPAADRRTGFAGITVYPYAPEWSVPAVFTPFENGDRTVTVPSADGRDRGLAVTGQIAFRLAGEPHTLTVSRSGDQLTGVISDATSGTDTYRFRFITLPAPDAEGRTVLDFNRAYLPPCAFSEHFICPFPPPGNRLSIAVRAGEKAVLHR
ncbi:DUF1684 domain-containing protein [Kitasatospora sp. NPDC052896]|uniref:DUF1684 domain-containing protein n=1 Tax=Kitasatospora sp. NPDC052896 TaxID=3364061 RepID=UPI0037CB80AF